MQILGYFFDAVVVFVTKFLIIFRLTLESGHTVLYAHLRIMLHLK